MMVKNKTIISSITITNPDWFDDMKHLPKCLDSLDWVDEKIIVTSKKTAKLRDITKRYQAKLFIQEGQNFNDWRNTGAKHAQGKWLLYVDTDERIPEKLRLEILKTINHPDSLAGYAIPRSNKILGKEFRHGGWWPDYVLRLMQQNKLEKWEGDLHEQPKIKGETGYLKQPLMHIKFQKLEDYLDKTISWSKSEAKLMQDANHPKLNTLRFFRLTIHPFLTGLFKRLIVKKGILDGIEGLIDAVYQSYSQFINYARLWELQLNSKNKI